MNIQSAHKVLFAALLMALTIPAVAQDAARMSLQECVDFALENSTVIRENARTIADTEQRKREALARGYPQISASLNYTNYLTLPVSLIPAEFIGGSPDDPPAEVQFGVPHNATVGADLSQLVFDGAYFLGVQAANKLVNIEVERVELNLIDLEHNVTQAYYTALIAGLRITSFERSVERLRELATETRALYDNGFVEEIEADRLDRTLSDLESSVQSAKRDHDLAMIGLKYQMNMDFDKEIELTDRLDSLLLAQGQFATEFQVSNRVEYQLLQLQEETNELNVKYNRSTFLPKIFLIAHYEQNAQRNEFDLFDFDQPWFQTAFIGARLEIPIFDGFQKRAGVERAKLQLEGIRLQQETLSRQLELQAAQSRTNYENATDRLASLQKSRDLAGKIFNVTQIKYREGVGSSLELTTAQSDFEVAEDQYIAALYELLIALSDLKKAYGQY